MEMNKGIDQLMRALDWDKSSKKQNWAIAAVLVFFFLILR
jgi:hypothetical protein